MLEAFKNALRVEDIRKRILYTFGLLLVFRVGSYIPVPGVDTAQIANQLGGNNIFGLLDMFAGGALSRFTVFALGVNPYITSSIIMQLLTVVIPSLEELAKEGAEGQKVIQKYTRWGTVVLGLFQAFGITMTIRQFVTDDLLPYNWTLAMILLTLTAGTCFLMWLGEKISEQGIGNGISLIIFTGIVARLPWEVSNTIQSVGAGGISIWNLALFVVISLFTIAAVIMVQEAQRRIPVHYSKRVVGRRVMGGQSTHIPLRLNSAGVIPVIFASSVLAFPQTLAMFIPALQKYEHLFGLRSVLYNVLYVILIFFFTYFYTAITFNPMEVANNIKKYGGFIPGIRPGKPTAEYLEKILTRITLVGAFFLALIAVLPYIVSAITRVTSIYWGGTSLLIVVGVALDTMKQLETSLIMRNYEGFMK
ncbi:MAG: preprotein translocase subunit SecY [Firmicutes bacterium]|nr:preprotein translocase subunit SecY [Bacillota bacterium]HQD38906.1 preprotein translocase subunit SecY [Bacillota bacterium]